MTAMLVGATVAMIALTAISLAVILPSRTALGLTPFQRLWPLLLCSSTATIMVMSLLQGSLAELYGRLAERERQASIDARTDALTGLGNRKHLLEQLAGLLGGPRATSSALMLLDLNRFKRVNDTLGHAIGDQLIVAVALRLKRLRVGDVARLGGDEFAILVEAQSDGDLDAIGRRVADSIAGSYAVGGKNLAIGASVGAVRCRPGATASEVLRQADLAMYRAKEGRRAYQLFDDSFRQAIARSQAIERALERGLADGGGLDIHYQAQVSRAHELVALEGLLRLTEPELGAIPPEEVVLVAEDRRRSDELALWVARRACLAAQRFPQARILLNFSPCQLLVPRLTERLLDVLGRAQLKPDQFQIEIPERGFIEHGPQLAEVLSDLVNRGFQLSADDFGTSSSSLNYLRGCGIDTVKLDRETLIESRRNGNIAVMKAKVDLAKALELNVVAEGIGDAKDAAIARLSGCDFYQGYYFHCPMPLDRCAAELPGSAMVKAA